MEAVEWSHRIERVNARQSQRQQGRDPMAPNQNNGLCECGCGERTRLAPSSHLRKGHIKGEPMRFVSGHSSRGTKRAYVARPYMTGAGNPQYGRRGSDSPAYKSGRRMLKGYVQILMQEDHPFISMAQRVLASYYVYEHRLVIAEHLGRPLLVGEHVHHKLECEGGTGMITDNRIENLLLFPDSASHMRHHHALKHDQRSA